MKHVNRNRARVVTLAACLALGLSACQPGGTGVPTPSATGGGLNAAAASTVSAPAKPSAPDPPKVAFEGDRMGGPTTPVVLSAQTESSPFRFTDVVEGSGVDFVHFSGMTEAKHFPTANGSGVGVIDYDNDGKLDLYFATATLLPLGTAAKGPNRLYKNLGGNQFRDVTAEAGVGFVGFCHGVVVGDVDNDGDPDLFLCNYGPNVLYLNNGDGTFKDVSKAAGVDAPNWSSGGAFLDYDDDGDLDLYVANYGQWKYPDDDKFCGVRGKKPGDKDVRMYCSPREIKTVKHLLYRNNGDGTFTDVYDRVILTTDPDAKERKPRSDGHGFGVVTIDLNGDGKIDIYVANDMNPNFVFLNKGDGTFEDATDASGAGFNGKGQTQSGMGVDAEDLDGDGKPEVLVTNFAGEYNTLFQNLGGGVFMDSTPYFGLAADTMPFVGWGTALVDFDNDGWPDNFVTNGHVDDNNDELGRDVPYKEPPLLFVNVKGKRFRLATRDAGPYFDTGHVGRGAAFADLDNDGDVDIVVNHKDGRPAILRNDTKSVNHWVRLELQGTRSNRDAVGAKVEVEADGRTIHRHRKGGVSMQSANDPRLLIGVGPGEVASKVTVRWPSGEVTVLKDVPVDQSIKVVEPAGPKTATAGPGR